MKHGWFVCVILIASSLFGASAQQFAELGDFPLINGDVIEACQIGYRIIGPFPCSEDELVVFPTWFGGTSEHVEGLIRTYNYIDTTTFTIIILDSFGNGVSSSPSNSPTQKNELFPEFTILDMVRAHYKVLTETLRVNHIYAVVGGSMGGMQAFQWMVTYPAFMEKIVAYVGTPRMTSRDLLHKEFQLRLIQTARMYHVPEERLMMLLDMSQDLVARTPEYLVTEVPTEDFEEYLKKFQQFPGRLFNSYNWESQVKAMMTHNIGNEFDNGYEEAIREAIADLLVIVNLQDNLVMPQPALELAEQLKAETVILNNKYGHLGIIPEIDTVLPAIHTFLER
ncbi:MAG: alpha/beta fold hydrolase [Candidatus Marinimicrobia bacterium]|nr:alpha/beta fold hydrolase [Candidatus Neomarinimicrobiota bacterium]MDD5582019.1 alpha/beta fold hydrolase [Candidatus Neomarinimicrobiota bacterium]